MGLCGSKGSRAIGCQSLKLKKNSAERPGSNPLCPRWSARQNFFWPPTLTARSSASLWPSETQSTSLERSKPPLLIDLVSVQESSRTFKVFYLHSKWPHFSSVYVVRVPVFFGSSVFSEFWFGESFYGYTAHLWLSSIPLVFLGVKDYRKNEKGQRRSWRPNKGQRVNNT